MAWYKTGLFDYSHIKGKITDPNGIHDLRYNENRLEIKNGEEWKDVNGSLTVTLLASGWTADDVLYTQTVDAVGVTDVNNLIVSPSGRDSTMTWSECEVLCSAQGANTLTFTCTTVPTADITVSVVILG